MVKKVYQNGTHSSLKYGARRGISTFKLSPYQPPARNAPERILAQLRGLPETDLDAIA